MTWKCAIRAPQLVKKFIAPPGDSYFEFFPGEANCFSICLASCRIAGSTAMPSYRGLNHVALLDEPPDKSRHHRDLGHSHACRTISSNSSFAPASSWIRTIARLSIIFVTPDQRRRLLHVAGAASPHRHQKNTILIS